MAKRSRLTQSSGTTTVGDGQLKNFAEDLGSLLGHAQNKAEGWLGPASITSGEPLLFADQRLRSKVSFQATGPFSLRVIADRNKLRSNPRLIALDPRRDWTVELLATYLVHPGTAVYVGYTDRREDQTEPDSTGARALAGTETRGRLLFVKMSVLLRP